MSYLQGYAVVQTRGNRSDFVSAWPLSRYQAKKRLQRLLRRGESGLWLYRGSALVRIQPTGRNKIKGGRKCLAS